MNITFYQSECGDAAKLSFIGNDEKQHYIFIDSGFERSFKNCIREDIEEIIKNNEVIDYWIVTHIHDDHIGGIKKYIDYIQAGELKDVVSKWIYNAPRFYNTSKSIESEISVARSIGQGDILYNYLSGIDKTPNIDFNEDTQTLDIFGLKIIFLTPTVYKLSALRTLYNINKMRPFELIEDDSISEASSASQNDYLKKISEFDLHNFTEDTNIENGSSISFIIELNDKRILWLADSHPSDVANSLSNLEEKYSSINKLKCNWVKVTHHGSKANNNNALYDLIESENYMISSNGENKHKLPNKEALARILRNSKRDIKMKYNLYYTYDNETLRNIFKIDGENVFKDHNFQNIYLKNKANRFDI